MRCAVTLSREPDAIVARCAEFPSCEGRAASPREALDRLRASVLFWLETCPCDVTADSGLVLDVVSDRSGG
jgi:hypothetical protein